MKDETRENLINAMIREDDSINAIITHIADKHQKEFLTWIKLECEIGNDVHEIPEGTQIGWRF